MDWGEQEVTFMIWGCGVVSEGGKGKNITSTESNGYLGHCVASGWERTGVRRSRKLYKGGRK